MPGAAGRADPPQTGGFLCFSPSFPSCSRVGACLCWQRGTDGTRAEQPPPAPVLPATKCAALAGAGSQGCAPRAPAQEPGIILVEFGTGSESIPEAGGQPRNSPVLLAQL